MACSCFLTATCPENCVIESVVLPDPPNLNLALVNPATRNYKLLPVSPIEYPVCYSKTKCEFITYGFGYDSVHDDYNVVRIAQFPDVKMNEVKIYSLKFNEWRRGDDFPYRLGCTTQAVYLNDALHWMATIPTQFGFDLPTSVAFDLATQEYRLIPKPPYSGFSEFMEILTVLGGKLCMNRNYDMRHIDMWVMESYGVGESWTKILKIVQNVDLQFMQLKPLVYSNNGKKVLLLKDGGELIWYDLELKVIKMESNPVIPDFWRAYVSLESLVKLNSGPNTGLPRVQRKMKKSKLDDFLSKGFRLVL
ncbi:F-box protein CPR1-like [Apium graveolens]|uniref:F-box protein CPR1-like n=1 Tax=Apium graveolens TaxID=4045 RepID=UPI003D79849F